MPEAASTASNQQIASRHIQSGRDRRALDALRNLSVAGRGYTTFRHIFAATQHELQAVFPFDACYIAVCDTVRPDTFRAVLMVDEGIHEYAEMEEFGTLTGLVISQGQPLLIGDLVERRARLAEVPTTFGNTGRQSRSWLGVPLLVGPNAIGVISIQSYAPNLYDEADVDLLLRIGDVVAVVLENTWLDEQQQALSAALAGQVAARTAELATLSSIAAELVMQQPLPLLLARALELIAPLFGSDAATIRILDPGRTMLLLLAQRGFSPEYEEVAASIPVSNTAPGTIVRENRPLVIDRGLRLDGLSHLAPHLPYTALLGVPLRIGERVLGALSLFSQPERDFPQQLVELAQAVGNQIAIAIENARLFTAQERQIRELDAIGQIGQLISASYDFEEMLNVVYQTLAEVAKPSVFYLLICEPETRVVSHAIFIENGVRMPLAWVGAPPKTGSLTDWILNQCEPLLFQDLPEQDAALLVRQIRPRSVGPEQPVRSWIGVPLLAPDNEPIGVLALQDYVPDQYDDQTIDFLSQVANHVSLGVQKVRLFEERARQAAENARLYTAEQEARRTADMLRDVAQVLSSSFDQREVLALMLRELNTVIAYDTASIMLLDRDTLRIAASRGFDSAEMQRDIQIHTQHSAAAAVVRQSAPLYVADVRTSPDWTPSKLAQPIRSWLGVPLIAKGAVIGVLNIDAHQPASFSERDLMVAQVFASQAAIALENARLYEDSITRVEQELEIARRIQSNLFPHALPQFAGLTLDARCYPARETGGDFYDFVPLNNEGMLALFIGDASGKSIPGAMLMAIAHSVVRSESRDHMLPELVMRETNAWIAQDVPPRSFVALCYATLDVPRKRLALANAGQLTPLRRTSNGTISYLDTPGPHLPLGIQPATAYEAQEYQLASGDLLVFVTDGIVEAQNGERELFGFERLESLLAALTTPTPQTLCDGILAAVAAFTGPTPPHDDMTIVALHIG